MFRRLYFLRVVREQWIRGKYERQEFINVNLQKYRTKEMEGVMWKKLKDKQNFMERRFVLSEKEYTLKYYNKQDVSRTCNAQSYSCPIETCELEYISPIQILFIFFTIAGSVSSFLLWFRYMY